MPASASCDGRPSDIMSSAAKKLNNGMVKGNVAGASAASSKSSKKSSRSDGLEGDNASNAKKRRIHQDSNQDNRKDESMDKSGEQASSIPGGAKKVTISKAELTNFFQSCAHYDATYAPYGL
ncbi:unnamed protein product, partial [Amoebophrya sp. A25]|eukprot:GSA25T00021630001.1